jgi:hypothetical protein
VTNPVADEDEAQFLVEEPRVFSESLLWNLQRRYYDLHGINAWGEGRIPFSISTSPHIAGAYARVFFGFLRDCVDTLDPTEPVYIVEIGAGSGRLGFNFLQQLTEFFDESSLRHIPFTYVLTDLVEKNVEFWESHEALQAFVEAGRLDFAVFDASGDDQMLLRHSGKVLQAGQLKNPVVLVGNYIFDTLPQDLFSVEDGQLYSVKTSLWSTQEEPDRLDPEIIGRLSLLYDREPVTADFYGDEKTSGILEFYRQTFSSTVLAFPRVALQCLDTFRHFSGERMLVLTADKGTHYLDDFSELDIPPIVLHDNGFSLSFNYHALTKYVEDLGGVALTPSFHYVSLNILGLALGLPNLTELRQAYRDFIDYNSPDDQFTGLLGFDRREDAAFIEILAYLRMKRYDTHAFLFVYPLMAKKFSAIPTALIPDIRTTVSRVWASYYHLNEKHNVPFHLGVISSAIGDFAESVKFFEASERYYGQHPTSLFNMALSLSKLGERTRALACLERISEPDYSRAEVVELRNRISAETG